MTWPPVPVATIPVPDAMKAATAFETVTVYKGQSIFLEPMITRATLLERKNFTLAIPDVPGKPANARYPTKFRADYDGAAQAYRFVFSDLR